MKTNPFLFLFFLVVVATSLPIFVSCTSDLEKTTIDVFQDGTLSDEELKELMDAFEFEGYSKDPKQRVKYVQEVLEKNNQSLASSDSLLIVNYGVQPTKDIVVNIYLDNTASMEGYMKSSNSGPFVSVFSGVAGFYQGKNATTLNAYYTQSSGSGNNKKTTIEKTDFLTLENMVRSQNTTFTDSYQLNEYFSYIKNQINSITQSNKDIICFLFTDGIPSGTNDEIKGSQGRRFSITNKDILQNRIANAIRSNQELSQNIGAAIYRFKSRFNGKYWKYNNSTVRINEKDRPFYVIAIGSKNLVKDFSTSVDNGLSSFKPLNQVVFLTPEGKFVPENKAMVEHTNGTTLKMKDPDDNHLETYRLFLFARNLPSYLHNQLSNNLKLIYDGDDVEFENEDGKITFEIEAQSMSKKTLHIELKDFLPAWIYSYNTEDDSNIGSSHFEDAMEKTFNLDILVRGIQQGIFNRHGESYFVKEDYTIDTYQDDF